MTVTQINAAAEPAKGAQRDQSSIQFPYVALDEAIGVVKGVHAAGGNCAREQLAVKLNQKPTSGSFAVKISAARMFGLIEVVQGRFKITQLGYESIASDEGRQRRAKAEAFLKVPLYRHLFEEFRGKPLPPRPDGLERAIEDAGVAPKQKTNARLALDRSAQEAGFFAGGKDWLVEPTFGPEAPQPEAKEDRPASGGAGEGQPRNRPPTIDQGLAHLDPLILALLRKIPATSETWPLTARARWVRTLTMIFDQIYASGDGDEDKDITLIIERMPGAASKQG